MSGEKDYSALKTENGVPIEAGMSAQSGVAEIVHALRQDVCMKV
jgi:hypothetical protein